MEKERGKERREREERERTEREREGRERERTEREREERNEEKSEEGENQHSAIPFTCPKRQIIDFSHACKHCISIEMASSLRLWRVVQGEGGMQTLPPNPVSHP